MAQVHMWRSVIYLQPEGKRISSIAYIDNGGLNDFVEVDVGGVTVTVLYRGRRGTTRDDLAHNLRTLGSDVDSLDTKFKMQHYMLHLSDKTIFHILFSL